MRGGEKRGGGGGEGEVGKERGGREGGSFKKDMGCFCVFLFIFQKKKMLIVFHLVFMFCFFLKNMNV